MQLQLDATEICQSIWMDSLELLISITVVIPLDRPNIPNRLQDQEIQSAVLMG